MRRRWHRHAVEGEHACWTRWEKAIRQVYVEPHRQLGHLRHGAAHGLHGMQDLQDVVAKLHQELRVLVHLECCHVRPEMVQNGEVGVQQVRYGALDGGWALERRGGASGGHERRRHSTWQRWDLHQGV